MIVFISCSDSVVYFSCVHDYFTTTTTTTTTRTKTGNDGPSATPEELEDDKIAKERLKKGVARTRIYHDDIGQTKQILGWLKKMRIWLDGNRKKAPPALPAHVTKRLKTIHDIEFKTSKEFKTFCESNTFIRVMATFSGELEDTAVEQALVGACMSCKWFCPLAVLSSGSIIAIVSLTIVLFLPLVHVRVRSLFP